MPRQYYDPATETTKSKPYPWEKTTYRYSIFCIQTNRQTLNELLIEATVLMLELDDKNGFAVRFSTYVDCGTKTKLEIRKPERGWFSSWKTIATISPIEIRVYGEEIYLFFELYRENLSPNPRNFAFARNLARVLEGRGTKFEILALREHLKQLGAI